ncbi:hypothetical protein [Sphingobacterium thalpophilum]|uniref:hypothetical protein n=1 Tax=Sphingobacterium thalpophilum TaxID=259 RepID=UPI000A6BA000|nr:hypothetical protein [Sphingobacterium thalpophilum]
MKDGQDGFFLLFSDQLPTNFYLSSGFHRDGIGISSSQPDEIPMKKRWPPDVSTKKVRV